MSSGGGTSKRGALGRQPSITSLEQSLNMVNSPPTIAPVTIYPGPGARHANMAKADLELVQRLQQLRGSGGEVPSEAEMEERLARLKGLPFDYYTKPAVPPLTTDSRTDVQKTQDLLTQMMRESELQSRLPAPDGELQSRLTQLRSDWSDGTNRPQPHLLDSPGLPTGLDDITEVAKLLQEASATATTEAGAALTSLRRDPALASVKGKHRRAQPRKHRQQRSSSSEKERVSDSSDDDTRRKVMVKRMGRSADKKEALDVHQLTGEDEEEVSRIVDMYTRKAAEKKKKKLMKKKTTAANKKAIDPKLMGKCEARVTETDSSSQLSESDLNASDSEKLSDTS